MIYDGWSCSVNEDLNGSHEWSCASWSLTRVKYTLRHRVCYSSSSFSFSSSFFFSLFLIPPHTWHTFRPIIDSNQTGVDIDGSRPMPIFISSFFLLLLVASDSNFSYLSSRFFNYVGSFLGGFRWNNRDIDVARFSGNVRSDCEINDVINERESIDSKARIFWMDGAYYGWLLIRIVYIIISKIISKKSI